MIQMCGICLAGNESQITLSAIRLPRSLCAGILCLFIDFGKVLQTGPDVLESDHLLCRMTRSIFTNFKLSFGS